MKICVIIPTYNEKDNLEVLVGEIFAQKVRDLGIIIVDDNSPDGTGKIADKLARKYKGKFWVIHRPGKLGLGSAYVAGWEKALRLVAIRSGLIIGMDGDMSHDPKELIKMIKMLETEDVVIGSRHIKNGAIVGFSVGRKILTSGAQMFSRWLLRLPVHDSTSAYRGYRRRVIEKIQVPNIRSSGYSFLIEVLYRAHKNGFKIAETPIVFGLRNGGESKVSKEEIFKALKTVFRLKFS